MDDSPHQATMPKLIVLRTPAHCLYLWKAGRGFHGAGIVACDELGGGLVDDSRLDGLGDDG